MRNVAWIFAATLTLACACAGQESSEKTEVRPYGTFTIAGSGGLGYLNPTFGGGLGFEASGRHWLQLSSFSIDSARKLETGNGFELSSSGLGMLRYKGALAGGGLRWVEQRTSRWSKSALRPEITGGFEWAPVRVIGRYILPGTD